MFVPASAHRAASLSEETIARLCLTPADVEQAREVARTTAYRFIDALEAVARLKRTIANHPQLAASFVQHGITDPVEQFRLAMAYESLT